MNRYLIAMTAIPLLVSASAGQAAPKTFGCDTAAGRFSEFKDAVRAEGLILRGTITPNEFRKDKRWAPSGWVRIGDDDTNVTHPPSCRRWRGQGGLYFRKHRNRRKNPRRDDRIGENRPVGFVQLSSDGKLGPRNGRREVDRSCADFAEGCRTIMACSTGDFVFENVEW